MKREFEDVGPTEEGTPGGVALYNQEGGLDSLIAVVPTVPVGGYVEVVELLTEVHRCNCNKPLAWQLTGKSIQS